MKRQASPLLEVNPADLGIYSDALNAQVAIIEWWSRFSRSWATGTPSLVPVTKSTPKRNVELGNAFATMLRNAETFYVHDTIARFIGGSVSGVPLSVALRTAELPARSGFLYFAEPIEMPCHAPDRHFDPLPRDWRERPESLHSRAFHFLRAMSWETMDYGGVRLAVDPSMAEGDVKLIVGDSFVLGGTDDDPRPGVLSVGRPEGFVYERPSVFIQTYVEWANPLSDVRGDPKLPLLRDIFVWNEGSPADAALTPSEYMAGTGGADDFAPITETRYVYGREDVLTPNAGRGVSMTFARRLLVALASFMHQQIPAETETRPNGLTRKRLAGTPYESRTIRVVHMRKRAPVESYSPKLDGETSRHLSGHWMVRPHPRNQWYRSLGPASDPSAHRLRWIESYEKGDLTKPLKPSRTLFAVVR